MNLFTLHIQSAECAVHPWYSTGVLSGSQTIGLDIYIHRLHYISHEDGGYERIKRGDMLCTEIPFDNVYGP